MRRTPLTAMLTIVAALPATHLLAACGGKTASSTMPSSTGTAPTTPHKHSSKPAY
jgi:hypothetical protein